MTPTVSPRTIRLALPYRKGSLFLIEFGDLLRIVMVDRGRVQWYNIAPNLTINRGDLGWTR